jgi:3'(2'), 5'-bisphosphate nucleotidase
MVLETPEVKAASFVSEIIREAGKAIMDIYHSDISVELKQDKSPLTLADRRSHEIIVSHLNQYSHYPVLSEEGKTIPYEERKNWKQFWLVDPLDGTKEFLKRNDEFTVNIALMQENVPVVGAIYIPAKDILYYAIKGKGAYKNDNGSDTELPLLVKPHRLTVVGSRSHSSKDFEDYIKTLEQEHGTVDIISAGSSLKFCLVADGKAHLYPRLGPTMEWDTAAGQIIVEETGGRVLEAGTTRSLVYNKPSLVNPYFVAMSMA